jgi:PAS domain S-box-containing protein
MQQFSSESEEILQLFILAAACIGAVLTTIFSLTHGIFEVFSFLYILPIILCVYFYPKRAVLFALGISLLYISLIYLLGFANNNLIAVAIAWFAIFMTIGVVAASYANKMQDEQIRIRNILENSQDGILCFHQGTERILEVNPKFAHWLRYDVSELLDRELCLIWTENGERERFIEGVKNDGKAAAETEGLFRAKDGTILRVIVSVLMVNRDRVFCSAIDITGSKIVDEEIRKTLEDLEEQVKARTAHLEQINEELRAEILERRRFEQTILTSLASPHDDPYEEKK